MFIGAYLRPHILSQRFSVHPEVIQTCLEDLCAEILNRKPLSAAASRVGTDPVQPQGIFGPKVMIVNERAGSGGDAMPWYFKRPRLLPASITRLVENGSGEYRPGKAAAKD